MKKKIWKNGAILLMALWACLACKDDKEASAVDKGPQRVRFFMATTLPKQDTRTESDEYLSTKFVTGDSVGIFVYQRAEGGADGERWLSNAKYTYDGSKWIAERGGEIVVSADDALNYYAYYPYNRDVEDYKKIPFVVHTDQSTQSKEGRADNYNYSDFLKTKNCETEAGADVVGLFFNHAFSLVQLNLSGTEATDPKMTVTLCGVKAQAVVDLTSDEAAIVEGEAVDVSMNQFSYAENNIVYRAVVPAQTIKGGAKMIEIHTGESVYTYNNTSDALDLNAMSVRPLGIVLGEPTSTETDVNMEIDPWKVDPEIELELGSTEDKPGEPDQPDEPDNPDNPDEPDNPGGISIEALTGGTVITDLGESDEWPSATAVGWFSRTSKGAGLTVASVDANGVMTVDNSTVTKGAWNGVAYNLGKCQRASRTSKYQLSFHVKVVDFGGGATANVAVAMANIATNGSIIGFATYDRKGALYGKSNGVFNAVSGLRTFSSEAPEGDFATTFELTKGRSNPGDAGFDNFSSLDFNQLMAAVVLSNKVKIEISDISLVPVSE